MNLSIDLETICDHPGCKYQGIPWKENSCDHALSPWHSKITVIGVYNEEVRKVFRSLVDFDSFIKGLPDNVSFLGHNFKFDLLHLHRWGINIPMDKWIGDSQLAAYVLTDKIPEYWLIQYNELRKQQPTAHRKGSKHSLKSLAPYLLGVPPFWEAEDKDDDEYVLKDAQYTYEIFHVLIDKLKEAGQYDFYINKQLPWTKMLLRAEMRGIEMDTELLAKKEVELEATAKDLRQRLDTIWHEAHVSYTDLLLDECRAKYIEMASAKGQTLDPGSRYGKLYKDAAAKVKAGVDYDSPKQMLWLLKDYYGYNCMSLENKEGTGAEILERLANEGKSDVQVFLDWRRVNKLLSSYIPTYKELCVGNVIRPIFNSDSTRTGRTSSQSPNLQQVPPSLRNLFVSREGYSFTGYDLSQVEVKLICLYSNDETLYSLISSGTSLHDFNTKLYFNLGADVPLNNIKNSHPDERSVTKNVGFGLFYNAGHNRVRITFTEGGFHLEERECREIVNRFREAYSTAVDYGMSVVKEFESGAVLPNLLGRPLKITDPQEAYMRGLNLLIQSSASDLNLEGARRTQEEYDRLGLDAHVVGFIHDFVLTEAHDSCIEQADRILKDKMTNFDLNCELGPISIEVEGGIFKRWSK